MPWSRVMATRPFGMVGVAGDTAFAPPTPRAEGVIEPHELANGHVMATCPSLGIERV